MKRIIFACLFLSMALFYVGCSDNSPSAPFLSQGDQENIALDKKPAAHLIGVMDLSFNLTAVPPDDPVWVGTINIEGYGTYGIRFFHTGGEIRGKANHFEENFEIYDQVDPTIVYLAGPDVGVVALANKPPEDTRFMANGNVELATGDFAEWLGRNTHMSGVVIWQILETPDGPVFAPYSAPGIFRIN